jgi:hypothetical protein
VLIAHPGTVNVARVGDHLAFFLLRSDCEDVEQSPRYGCGQCHTLHLLTCLQIHTTIKDIGQYRFFSIRDTRVAAVRRLVGDFVPVGRLARASIERPVTETKRKGLR